jgi:succinate dehydrogenase / fumarate reductase, cytochrome b subunit
MALEQTTGSAKKARPMSPHLQVYRPIINMVMSILHRITGAALYFGSLILAWWLVAAASGPAYFDYVSGLIGSWPGRIILFGYTWALINHALGGIRHFIWDTGRGYDLETIDKMSWWSLFASIALTALIWAFVLTRAGSAA